MLDKGKMRKGGLLTYLLPEREEDVYRPLRPLFLSLSFSRWMGGGSRAIFTWASSFLYFLTGQNWTDVKAPFFSRLPASVLDVCSCFFLLDNSATRIRQDAVDFISQLFCASELCPTHTSGCVQCKFNPEFRCDLDVEFANFNNRKAKRLQIDLDVCVSRMFI